MPEFSGSYVVTVQSEMGVHLLYRSDHQISLSVASGTQQSTDDNWQDAKLTIYAVTDLVRDYGEQRGYFHNEHPNGGSNHGTFEAKLTGTSIAGTWEFTGGTGKYAKLTGKGVFHGKQTSLTVSEASWSGNYNLG